MRPTLFEKYPLVEWSEDGLLICPEHGPQPPYMRLQAKDSFNTGEFVVCGRCYVNAEHERLKAEGLTIYRNPDRKYREKYLPHQG